MLKNNQSLADLQNNYQHTGKIEWIGIRPDNRSPMQQVECANLILQKGIEGDHACFHSSGGKRQVTLLQYEHLPVIASLCGIDIANPKDLRRNLLVSGINILSCRDKIFRIGREVILQGTGPCHPCSRMEENLGAGGYNAVRGHGGITAVVTCGGIIQLGDRVTQVID